MYWFGKISLNDFIQSMPSKEEGVRIKDVARQNGYILKNCKLYAYAYYAAQVQGESAPDFKEYGVTKRDAALLRRLNLTHLSVKKYKVHTLKEFDAAVEYLTSECPEIKKWIGKLVSKKMMFLIKSYGLAREEIESILKEAAVAALYKRYPRYESYLHFTNVAKTTMHNTAMSMISFYTTKGRARLQKNEEGAFEAVHVDVAVLTDVTAPPSYGSHLKELLEGIASLEEKLPPKAQQLLMCLAGHHDKGFSEYIEVDNTEAVEAWSYERYLRKVRNYFEVTEEQTNRLFKFIAKRI